DSNKRISEDIEFKNLNALIQKYKNFKDRKTVSLNLEKRLKTYEEDLKIIKEQEKLSGIDDTDELIDKNNSENKINPSKDIHLREALNITCDLCDTLKINKVNNK
ncbi:MAG TPA: carboxy terminal-processing peptidase, partial [Victivallales bacterium]|nr:carboxy terminal-processing peptidase [Victivallales bacterium]